MTGSSDTFGQPEKAPPEDKKLKSAIIACSPFRYLDDLKKAVAAHLGVPDLAENRQFGMRVYMLEREVTNELREIRITAMGFLRPSHDLLASLENRQVEMLFGIGGLMGEEVRLGRIKADGRGGFLFIPKGKRTKGYHPSYIRKPVHQDNPIKSDQPAMEFVRIG